jgi:hypothetical protein
MEILHYVSIQIKKTSKEGKEYVFSFLIPNGTTWGDSIDAAYEVLEEVHKESKRAIEQVKPIKTEVVE